MRRLGLTVGAGVLVLLGACAGNTDQAQPGSAPSLPIASGPTFAPPMGSPAYEPPPGAGAVPPGQLDAGALPEGFPREVWSTGSTIAARAQEGGCGKASAEVTEQSPVTVVLTLVETQPANPPVCTMDIRYPVVTVTITEPLGARTVTLRFEQRTA